MIYMENLTLHDDARNPCAQRIVEREDRLSGDDDSHY